MHRIYSMSFARIYPLYIKKVERKGRTKEEVAEVIAWLTGYKGRRLKSVLKKEVDFETFLKKHRSSIQSGNLLPLSSAVYEWKK